MFRTVSNKMLGAALLAATLATGLAASTSAAQAAPQHGWHGGYRHHGGHWGWRHRGWGPRYAFGYYGCYSRPRFDAYGNFIGRVRICR